MLSAGDALPTSGCDAWMPEGHVQRLDLNAQRGVWLVLVFWPFDFTRDAAAVLREYAASNADFALSGATLLGASVDSVHVHRAWIRQGLTAQTFPLLSDVTRELASACGVLGASGAAAHACFIVDPEGVVASACTAADAARPSATDTLRRLHSLQGAEVAAGLWRPDSDHLAA